MGIFYAHFFLKGSMFFILAILSSDGQRKIPGLLWLEVDISAFIPLDPNTCMKQCL